VLCICAGAGSTLKAALPHTLQDFCSLALDALKSYKPEIKRLEHKNDGVQEDLSQHKALMRQALVGCA